MKMQDAKSIARKINELIHDDYGEEAAQKVGVRALSRPVRVAIGRLKKERSVALREWFTLQAETMEGAIAEYKRMRNGTYDFEWGLAGEPPENVIDYLLDEPESSDTKPLSERLDIE